MTVDTMLAVFARSVRDRAGAPALHWGSQTLTWADYGREVCAVAGGLARLGVRHGDHVVLLMRNRPEFYVIDTACMVLGAIPVSVYLSPDIDALRHVMAMCSPKVCVAENATFVDRVRSAAPGGERLIVGIDDETAAPDVVAYRSVARGPAVRPDLEAVTPQDTVTMLFTSGTTGAPKGVPLSHANIRSAVDTLSKRMGVSLTGRRQLSYLPMAHIGERLATHYLHMAHGSTVTCCADLAEFPATLHDTAPHMLFGAPRMWERLHDGINARLDADPALRAKAENLAPEHRRAVLHDLLVTVGVADVEVAIVGSAPLPRHVQQFWLDLGVPLADCYGQTENCGMGTWNPHDIVLGTCGTPFDGTELSITETGEILVRGPSVFGGYYRDQAATERAIDADGWYHTGDLGRLDGGGNLVLRGRMNDVLVPTSGHNVSPTPIEQKLCRIPFVGHAVLIGHGRPHLTAVLALDPEAVAAHDGDRTTIEAVVADGVRAVNDGLPGAERVRRHVVVEPWSLASDVLTATGKLRRRGVAQRYADEIEGMYR